MPQHSGRPSSKSALSVDGTLRPRAWPPWAKRRAIQFNEHLTGDGPTVFKHVCRMGLEGIVSKRMDAPYRSGPSRRGSSRRTRRARRCGGSARRSGTNLSAPKPSLGNCGANARQHVLDMWSPPVAGNHAFVIIHSPTGVGTSAHAIRGSILTLKSVLLQPVS